MTSGKHADWALEPVNYEGWRVVVDEGSGRQGWLLLRQSLHDPLLVLNVESEVKGGVAVAAARVLEVRVRPGWFGAGHGVARAALRGRAGWVRWQGA